MKRIQRTKVIELEIEAVFNTAMKQEVAANARIELEDRDMPEEYQLSYNQYVAYKNFVNSVVSVIRNFGYEMLEQYQSSKSYSYYITFKPDRYYGFEDDIQLNVIFRLSDHGQQISPKLVEEADNDSNPKKELKTEGRVFKEFVVEGVRCENIADALVQVKSICKDLKVGDYSKFY